MQHVNSQYLIVPPDVTTKNAMRIVYMDQDYLMTYWYAQKHHHALLEKISHALLTAVH